MEDHYKVLGLKKDATAADVRQAYKRQALRWHPDKNPNDRATAETMFKKVAAAYKVLSDPQQRRRYDDSKDAAAAAPFASSAAPTKSSPATAPAPAPSFWRPPSFWPSSGGGGAVDGGGVGAEEAYNLFEEVFGKDPFKEFDALFQDPSPENLDRFFADTFKEQKGGSRPSATSSQRTQDQFGRSGSSSTTTTTSTTRTIGGGCQVTISDTSTTTTTNGASLGGGGGATSSSRAPAPSSVAAPGQGRSGGGGWLSSLFPRSAPALGPPPTPAAGPTAPALPAPPGAAAAAAARPGAGAGAGGGVRIRCLAPSGVAYRRSPSFPDRLAEPRGPALGDVIRALELRGAWAKCPKGWLPLQAPDGAVLADVLGASAVTRVRCISAHGVAYRGSMDLDNRIVGARGPSGGDVVDVEERFGNWVRASAGWLPLFVGGDPVFELLGDLAPPPSAPSSAASPPAPRPPPSAAPRAAPRAASGGGGGGGGFSSWFPLALPGWSVGIMTVLGTGSYVAFKTSKVLIKTWWRVTLGGLPRLFG